MGLAPAAFTAVAQEKGRDADKVRAIVNSMPARYLEADRDYAEKLKAARPGSALAVVGSEGIADPAARRGARATLDTTLKVIDDGLKRRERIPQDAIAEVRATKADDKTKEAVVAAIREMAAGPAPLSVQLMNAMRAFLAKALEVVTYVDRHAAGVGLKEGRLHFSDKAVSARFQGLQSELSALYQEIQRLSQKAKGGG
jgi:hypothetical protein